MVYAMAFALLVVVVVVIGIAAIASHDDPNGARPHRESVVHPRTGLDLRMASQDR